MGVEGDHKTNSLNRDGTHQSQRFLETLHPKYAPIDDRGIADLLVYARKFAEKLRYYPVDGNSAGCEGESHADGTWVDFFDRDLSVLIALIQHNDLSRSSKQLDSAIQKIKSANEVTAQKVGMETLLNELISLADTIHNWYRSSAEGHSLRQDLGAIMRGRAKALYQSLVSWIAEAESYGLTMVLEGQAPNDLAQLLNSRWLEGEILPEQPDLFPDGYLEDPVLDLSSSIVRLKTLHSELFTIADAIKSKSNAYFQESMESFNRHQPHMALFISFLLVLAFAVKQLNEITNKHLLFYYQEVLKLGFKPPEPDRVHLIFELAKSFAEGKVASDTRFLAGKGDDGQDILFQSVRELVVNQVHLEDPGSLRTIYQQFQSVNGGKLTTTEQIFCAPIANSKDGQGEAFDVKGESWPAMGGSETPPARIGFALASPMFLLREGKRDIHVTFYFDQDQRYGLDRLISMYGQSVMQSELRNNINIYFSGEKEWLEIVDKKVILSSELIRYHLTLPTDFPPVIAFNGESLPERFKTEFPVLKFELDNQGLSSIGDLDLQIAAGLSDYRENEHYATQEFVLYQNGGKQELFQANGEVRGSSGRPDTETKVWRPVEMSQVQDYQILAGESVINSGTLVHWRGNNFRATATFLNQAPDRNSFLWEDLSQDSFDPNTRYLKNDLVSYRGQIYMALKDQPTQTPGANSAHWMAAVGYNAGQSDKYEKGALVQYLDGYYIANEKPGTISPYSTSSIWFPYAEIPWFDSISDMAGVLEGSKAISNTPEEDGYSVYRANVDLKFLADPASHRPEDEISIWTLETGLSIYNPDREYVIGDQVAYSLDGKSFKRFQLNALELKGLADELRRPEPQHPIWKPIPEFSPDMDDLKPGDQVVVKVHFVETEGENGKTRIEEHVYELIKPFKDGDMVFGPEPPNGGTINDYSEQDGSYWEHRTPENPVNAYAPKEEYQVGAYVADEEQFFLAQTRNLDIKPSDGTSIWRALEEILRPEAGQKIDSGTLLLLFEDGIPVLIRPNLNIIGIPPVNNQTTDEYIWMPVDEPGIREYSDAELFEEGDLVAIKFDRPYPAFFKANLDTENVAPIQEGEQLPVWEKVWVIESFDPIREYRYKVSEGPAILVNYQGRLYKPKADFSGFAPDSGKRLWEKIPERSQIEAYEEGKDYPLGALVTEGPSEQIYQAQFSNFNIRPSSGKTIWERVDIPFRAYDSFTTFHPGEYVQYGGKSYRPKESIFGVKPTDDPEKWLEVGRVVDYSSSAPPYLARTHVLYHGKVFKAKSDILSDMPPHEGSENWEKVSYSYPYKYLKDLELSHYTIEVAVEGVKELKLENDQGILTAGKPFMPFGTNPKVGSRFYLGNWEVFQKPLQEVTLIMDWANLPLHSNGNGAVHLDFPNHYGEYKIRQLKNGQYEDFGVDNNEYFKAQFLLLQDGQWLPRDNPQSLFENWVVGEKTAYSINVSGGPGGTAFKREPDLPEFNQFRPSLIQGFLIWELTTDFRHQVFPKLLTQIPLTINDENAPGIPNEPYTPLIKDLSLDYRAKLMAFFNDKDKSDYKNRVEQLFQLAPFGHQEIYPLSKEISDDEVCVSRHLVPRFTVVEPQNTSLQPTQEEDAAGNLYIGLKSVQAPQNVALLFQVDEASAEIVNERQAVIWSYFRKNRWINFNPKDIVDETMGLLRTGIITFSLPAGISNEQTLFPSGTAWIKASVKKTTRGIPKMIAVFSQAGIAEFLIDSSDPARLEHPLPPLSIKSLRNRLAAIKSVRQPLPSFGGQVEEPEIAFMRRISERLRHKGRAITMYDFERLVLEHFPDIQQVKCIPHTNPCIQKENDQPELVAEYEGSATPTGNCSAYAPGYIHLIVLPYPRARNSAGTQKPKVDSSTLEQIQRFLKKKANPFLELKVDIPDFEDVKVKAGIKLHQNKDPQFYRKKVQDDLKSFLAPWSEHRNAPIRFGGRLDPAAVTYFLEELDYVDYIADLELVHLGKPTRKELVASKASAILVSADEHDIQIIGNE